MIKPKTPYSVQKHIQDLIWKHAKWRPVNTPFQVTQAKSTVTKAVIPWLFETGSLTKRLLEVSQNALMVQPYHEGWRLAPSNTASILHLKKQRKVWERLAILYGQQTPWVMAQTIVPRSTLQGKWREIMKLGNQSLGQLIFSGSQLRLEQRYIASIDNSTIIASLEQQGIHSSMKEQGHCWARRSIYLLTSGPIMVAELFLPSLIER